MKRELHELLHKLADDSEIPEEPGIFVSDASRQKVDAIVRKINQEQTSAPVMPKPVYDKPPQYKRQQKPPQSVSHFSETPSQSPVVRMHDRLLGETLPPPDHERRLVRKNESARNISKSHKKKKKQIPGTRKKFKVEITDELPPDIPRDTSVAERIRQEKLEAVLASAPPRTKEDIRKEQVKERAARIRELMKQHEPAPEPVAPPPPPEPLQPEEVIPAWEDELTTFSGTIHAEHSEQMKVFENVPQLKAPPMTELPEIIPEEDTSLTELSEKLVSEGAVPEEPEEVTPFVPAIPKKKKQKHKKKQKQQKKPKYKAPGFILRIAMFWENFLKKNKIRRKKHLKQKQKKSISTEPEPTEYPNTPQTPAIFQPPPKVTEIRMNPQPPPKPPMNLEFTETVILEAVPEIKKNKKKVKVTRRVRNTNFQKKENLS